MWKKEQAAALCVFMIGGVGALLAVIGILLAFRQKRKIRNCTSYTTGWVVRHCFPGRKNVSHGGIPSGRKDISGFSKIPGLISKSKVTPKNYMKKRAPM